MVRRLSQLESYRPEVIPRSQTKQLPACTFPQEHSRYRWHFALEHSSKQSSTTAPIEPSLVSPIHRPKMSQSTDDYSRSHYRRQAKDAYGVCLVPLAETARLASGQRKAHSGMFSAQFAKAGQSRKRHWPLTADITGRTSGNSNAVRRVHLCAQSLILLRR